MTSMYPLSPSSLGVAGVFAFVGAGCATSSPPTEQMAVAQASVARAHAVGARGLTLACDAAAGRRTTSLEGSICHRRGDR